MQRIKGAKYPGFNGPVVFIGKRFKKSPALRRHGGKCGTNPVEAALPVLIVNLRQLPGHNLVCLLRQFDSQTGGKRNVIRFRKDKPLNDDLRAPNPQQLIKCRCGQCQVTIRLKENLFAARPVRDQHQCPQRFFNIDGGVSPRRLTEKIPVENADLTQHQVEQQLIVFKINDAYQSIEVPISGESVPFQQVFKQGNQQTAPLNVVETFPVGQQLQISRKQTVTPAVRVQLARRGPGVENRDL